MSTNAYKYGGMVFDIPGDSNLAIGKYSWKKHVFYNVKITYAQMQLHRQNCTLVQHFILWLRVS